MAKSDEVFEHAVLGVVTRIPGRAVAALALLFYPGLGLALPLALRWPMNWLFSANLIGAAFAAVVGIGWLGFELINRDRRHLLDWTTDLRRLDAEEFEWLVGEMFQREGWRVRETGRQDRPDGNIDLELERAGERRIVQCKRWESWRVGVDVVRELGGTLMREGLPGTAGTLVTLSDFHRQARDEARTIGVQLVNGRDLHARLERVRRAEPCPLCTAPMLLDRSVRGWWFRCVASPCKGKLDLANDPGRARAYLTTSR